MHRFLLGSAAVASAFILTACGSSGGGTGGEGAAAPDAGGAVTFTHPTEEGLELSFDQQPETLVMDCYAYSSLHEHGVEPDALFGFECENPLLMGDIDISGIERIGQDAEINVEKLAEIRPDAIIGQGSAEGSAWFDEDVNSQLTRVASFIPLPSGDSLDADIEATREVAAFLGGDTESEAVQQADADWAAAKEDFSAAVEGKEMSVLFASPTKEMLYTGVGFPHAELLEELGATVVGPPAPEQGNPWGQVAWEEAATYPADYILAEGYTEEKQFSSELWDDLPAVKAGQVSGWVSKGAQTSRAHADWLTDLTTKVESYEKVA